MIEPPRLRELQLRLRELIVRFGDASEASRAALEEAAAALPIQGDRRLSAGRRLAIYAEMHRMRIRDALVEDFAGTAAALGPDLDTFLADYLTAHPTDDPSLRQAGRFIADFLATVHASTRPAWLPDLAALEWAMVEAFDARDEEILSPADLSCLTPDDWPDLRLEPVRSLRVLSSPYPVERIRRSLLEGEPIDAAPAGVRLRIWRQGVTVFHRRLSEQEARALDLLRAGATFGALCQSLSEEDEATAAERALGLLRLWLGDELLVALPKA